MSYNKVATFMLSNVGKKVSYFTAGTLSTVTMCAYFLPHTIFLEKYKKLIQLYRNGFSVPLTKELQDRFQKTLELLEIDTFEKLLYNPFFAYGFDVTSAGSSYSKFGAIIGLPINFSYNSIDAIDKSKIKINQESVVWDSEPAQDLLNSLILSEKAQSYAMAREILYRRTPKPLIDTALATNFVILAYSLSRFLNNKFNFYVKPLSLRLSMYTLVTLFSSGIFVMSKDMSQIYFENKIDKNLCERNKIFLEGGKEYYSKILERNKALRLLLGKEGERKYSVLGNENSLFRSKHIPIVQRLSNFES